MTINRSVKQLMVIMVLAMCVVRFGAGAIAGANNAAIEPYLSWFKPANAHLRTAISYLRTGNNDFAALALEDLIAAKAPELSDETLRQSTQAMAVKAQTALDLIDNNQPKKARALLLKTRAGLFEMHSKANIQIFDDCIWALVKKGPALWHFRKNKPDLNNSDQRQNVATIVADYLQQLNLCDRQATAQMKADGSYQRIVTGARKSLERIPAEALANRDGGQLFRFIIELKSFDQLLYLRFG